MIIKVMAVHTKRKDGGKFYMKLISLSGIAVLFLFVSGCSSAIPTAQLQEESSIISEETTLFSTYAELESTFSDTETTLSETTINSETIAETTSTATEATTEATTETTIEATQTTTQTTPETTTTMTMVEATVATLSQESIIDSALISTLPLETYSADSASVNVSGRTLYKDGVRWINYSYSSVEFQFTGTKAEITMVSNPNSFKSSNRARVGFVVNGVMVKDVILNNTQEKFTVFESETPQDVVIKVVKLSEVQFAKAGVKYISVQSENKISPTLESERTIEFIGDSITCAYGIEGQSYDDFSTHTENAYNSYAAQTARNLGAEASIVAWSGLGIVSDCTTYAKKSAYLLMSELYNYTDFSYESTTGQKLTEWDFEANKDPDVIVINMGTNDATYTGSNATLIAEFGTGFYNFLKQVREKNPDSTIICIYGVLEGKLTPEISKQVENFKSTIDTNIHMLELPIQSYSDGYGADYHPSLSTHNKMTVALTMKIREIMGW